MAVRSLRIAVAAIVSVTALAACGRVHEEGKPEPPNDGNIAAMFLAANNTDISYAHVALTPGRTKTKAILGFAQRMVEDHSGLNQAMTELLANTGIVPEDNIVSLNFRDESAAKRDTLRERNDAVFDSTYIANEVRYHTKLLVVIDSVLLPATRNRDLKSFLTGVRPAVANHLDHAQRVQAGLGK